MWMSCIGNSSDSLYTKYVNPVYVTAISSPTAVPSLRPLLLSNPPSNFHVDADSESHILSARSRRHHTEVPYVVRRASTAGSHRSASTSDISGITKSFRKLKFSRISNDLISEPCTVILQSEEAVGSGINAGDYFSRRPISRDDLETSRSVIDLEMPVLNIDDCNSLVNGERNLE